MNNKLKKILNILKKELSVTYKKDLASIILYGSQARNDSEKGSDIDILVVLTKDVNPVAEIRKVNKILSEISLQFNELISCVFMSQDRYNKEKSPLVLNIKKEGVVL